MVLHKLGGEITFTQAEMDTLNLDYQKRLNHDGSITFKSIAFVQPKEKKE